MGKQSHITELSEILATALAQRPELNERLSNLLGSRVMPAPKKVTRQERRNRLKALYSGLARKEQLKKQS